MANKSTEAELSRVQLGDFDLIVIDVPSPLLSADEIQVAELAASGASPRDIARQAGTTVQGVASHLVAVCDKLGVTSLRELAAALTRATGR